MIISVSRRTDIPAFYSQWFMNRVRAGWCLVPNPLNMKHVSKVLLQPKDVDAFVFWSKNPAPLIKHLDELDKLGFRYYFQFTLNDYPRALEPNVPSLETRIATFQDLSRRVSLLRIVWRYDPIIISNRTPLQFHRERFSWIAEELRGATRRVMISIVDYYRKTKRRLSQLENEEDFSFDKDPLCSAGIQELLSDLAVIARKNKIEIFTCAEQEDYSKLGIAPGRCIDDRLLSTIWSLNLTYKKDPFQRKACLCMVSKDIGMNNTCIHGCPYCYSTMDYELAIRRHSEHNPESPLLWGHVEEPSEITQDTYGQKRLL